MKWSRAIHQLESLAQSCAEMVARPATMFPLRVTQLWAAGDILGPVQDLDIVTVALCVDLPAADVAWWTEPPGSQHWANAVRLNRNPFRVWWRSAHAPVWNHRIVAPALVWDDGEGVREATLAALAEGRAEPFRSAAPSAEERAARLHDDVAISLAALTSRTRTYEKRRWSPGRLEPVADALWQAADGYLDLIDATG